MSISDALLRETLGSTGLCSAPARCAVASPGRPRRAYSETAYLVCVFRFYRPIVAAWLDGSRGSPITRRCTERGRIAPKVK